MTANANHLETWLTEEEAAARLGISERTLRRKTAAGEGPEKRERQRAGLRPESVYNPDDVARLAAPAQPVFAPGSAIAPRTPVPARCSTGHRRARRQPQRRDRRNRGAAARRRG